MGGVSERPWEWIRYPIARVTLESENKFLGGFLWKFLVYHYFFVPF